MAVDLHLHTKWSDGDHQPDEVVARAVQAGLTTIAITDHDVFAGIDDAIETAGDRIAVIPGVELSVEWGERNMHLLGYWVAAGSTLDEELVDVRESRLHRNQRIVDALRAMGIAITVDDVLAESQQGVVTRPDVARILIGLGVVENVAEAFNTYLGEGGPAYFDRKRLTVERAVALVAAAGGVTAVAHPHTVADDADGFRRAFAAFADLGIVGVECWYSEYPVDQREAMARMAERHGLVATGGSDFHGASKKPTIEVGVGKGDLVVPDRVVEELAARRP